LRFGGHRDEAPIGILGRIVRDHLASARRVAWVDLHTGLGAYGDFVMLTALPPDDPAVRRGRDWYGTATQSIVAGDAVSPQCHGSIDLGLLSEFPGDCTLTFFAQEFGTYAPTRVFQAMRADNWLHHHGDPGSATADKIRGELVEVFRPADPAWQRRVLQGGAGVVAQTVSGIAASVA